MAGTKTGGEKIALINKTRYGKGFYAKIGAMGGKANRDKPRGFAAMTPEQRRACGKIGGTRSRRRK
jgi:hypothetical protein